MGSVPTGLLSCEVRGHVDERWGKNAVTSEGCLTVWSQEADAISELFFLMSFKV